MNPNTISIPNGNYFAFPYSIDNSEIVLLSIPWDVTTSYGKGTAKAPQAIINASAQLDFFDHHTANAWETKIATIPINNKIFQTSNKIGRNAEKIIRQLEQQKPINDKLLNKINLSCNELNEYVEQQVADFIKDDKRVGIVGGDHSVPLGAIKALSKKYNEFGILHIDAHCDLREKYEGFEFSHASIMFNALKIQNVKKLVQVGVRDICPEEYSLQQSDKRIADFNDFSNKRRMMSGETWKNICEEIIDSLPEKVYVSFDIDGLSPENCPHTGTPVPGGLSYNEAVFLLNKLKDSKKTIIGFDLCEVSPANDAEWDANVGARILYQLCLACSRT